MPEPRSLLIVEDDLSTRTLLEAIARRNHFRAVVCSDGRAALSSIDRDDFAVILLDLQLPELDGFAVLQRLAAAAPHLLQRTIVVTALAQARLGTCPEIARVWGVVRKPFELQMLEEHIRACSGNGTAP